MDINRILDLDNRADRETRKYKKKRFAYQTLETTQGRPFVAIIGPRGVGKTVLLRQLRQIYTNSLYLSADTLSRGTSIKEIIRYFSEQMGITRFFIDEIHFIPTYAADLKELYDFTSIHIWFTSSVSLSLYSSAWDLSRRVRTILLYPFSFREYLFFRYENEIAPLSLQNALFQTIDPRYLRLIPFFDEYLKGGLYPFLLEPGATPEQFTHIMEKILQEDIPNFDPQLSLQDVTFIRKILSFIGRSPIDGINYSSISRNVGVTKYKAEKFLTLLERSFLVRRAFPGGTNVLKEPKVFMELPYRTLFRDFEDCVGELREDFFALAMAQHGVDFFYAKTTRGKKTPDFILDLDGNRVIVEIGGAGKGRSQFKGLEYDKKIVLFHDTGVPVKSTIPRPGVRVPLHCLGFG